MISTKTTSIDLVNYCLKFSGVMNYEDRPWSLLITAYHMFMINLMGLTSVLDIIWGTGNLIDFVKAMSTFTIYLHENAKAINIILHQKEIQNLLEKVEKHRVEIYEDYENRHHLIKQESYARKCITFFSVSLMSLPFFSLITNFIADYLSDSDVPHLGLQVWIPWSMKEFWPYIAGMLFVTLLALTAGIYYIAFSSLEFAFTFQISAFLKVLQNHLETHGPSDKNIYRHYINIMQILQDYNKLFSGQMYLEIIVSSLQPCGFGYALIKVLKGYDPGALDLVYKFVMCVAAPLIVCACGQEISTQVERLHQSSYNSEWYKEKLNIRRDLLTLMSATIKPIELNYRSLVSFNYACFATVAQGIYTYLTMIINVEAE